MADKYGRIPVLVATNMFGFIAGMATIFTRAFWYFGLCRFLVGFASDNNFTMMYILLLEYVGPKYRTLVANVSIAVCFPLACCSLPWLAFYLADWKTFAVATSAPLAFAIVTPLVVPESVRWLVCQGRIDEAVEIMRRIERVNKADVPEWTYSDFKEDAKKLKDMMVEEDECGVSDLFRTPRLRRFTILLMAIWGIIAMVFDGHIRNLGALGLNVFVTFTVSSLTTFPADILVALYLDYYGRRWSSFASLFLSGLACFLASLTSGVYFASLGLIGRFLINVSYSIGLQYAAELLPTEIRAKGVSLIHIFGYATAIVSPFIAYTRVLDRRSPIIILGILSTIGGILCLFLPETLNRELSQSLQEGEDFGKDQRFFDMPCIGSKEYDDKPNKHYLHAHRTTTRGEVLRSSIISGAVGSRYRLQSIWSQQTVDADDRISRASGTSDRKIFHSSETSSLASNGTNDPRD
ncbi:organic cation transporter protein-like [Athalia rosae]|uniref:organic cation transporter protein-like n=1 Tax=Athalia rosae TaxID=37344 RepID=UPI00203343AA|nr:organic cation transporter protein-like [Athalia rosae]